jgi:hypothetical protein
MNKKVAIIVLSLFVSGCEFMYSSDTNDALTSVRRVQLAEEDIPSEIRTKLGS